jgi:hypothetical protein
MKRTKPKSPTLKSARSRPRANAADSCAKGGSHTGDTQANAPAGNLDPVVPQGAPLEALVTRLVRRFGSRKRLAKAVGISLTALSRGVKHRTYNLETCLKIATTTGESLDYVLRCAGKADTADLIDLLYGGAARARLEADKKFLEQWHCLSQEHKTALQTLLQMLAERQRGRTARPGQARVVRLGASAAEHHR